MATLSLFHGENRGSIPLGRGNNINPLARFVQAGSRSHGNHAEKDVGEHARTRTVVVRVTWRQPSRTPGNGAKPKPGLTSVTALPICGDSIPTTKINFYDWVDIFAGRLPRT